MIEIGDIIQINTDYLLILEIKNISTKTYYKCINILDKKVFNLTFFSLAKMVTRVFSLDENYLLPKEIKDEVRKLNVHF